MQNPSVAVRYSDVRWMNNSVLDFLQCAKIKRSKLLQELKDYRLRGNSSHLGFYSSTLN